MGIIGRTRKENEEEMAKEKETGQSGIREIKREAYFLETAQFQLLHKVQVRYNPKFPHVNKEIIISNCREVVRMEARMQGVEY